MADAATFTPDHEVDASGDQTLPDPTEEELAAFSDDDQSQEERRGDLSEVKKIVADFFEITGYDTQLLSPTQERELAWKMEGQKNALSSLLAANQGLILLSEGERALLEQQVADGEKAREELICRNYRLVVNIALGYNGLPLVDLINWGLIGLTIAADKFEVARGKKFSTLATWWIWQSISRAVGDHVRTIRLPLHLHQISNKVRDVAIQLEASLGYQPSFSEIRQKYIEIYHKKIDLISIEGIMKAMNELPSLEQRAGDTQSGDGTLADFVEDPVMSVQDTVDFTLLQECIRRVLEKLPGREAELLTLRYGLDTGEMMTLEQVGKQMGIGGERVRQLERQAFHRIKTSSSKEILLDFLRAGFPE
jgi:RNA polymerase sigma factor (sigma-70 family)